MDRNFRAALNGFNRSDVVAYIEECAINHEKALRQLRDENARLRADLEKLQTEKAQAEEARAEEPVEPAAVAQPAEEPAAPEQPEPAAEPAPEVVPIAAPSTNSAEELAAYRRAEAVERAARSRASALCRQVNAIMDSTSKQLEESRGDVDTVMSDLNICLRQLNDAFAQLRMIFDDAAHAFSKMEAIKSDEEV